jgi:hypothetical protein
MSQNATLRSHFIRYKAITQLEATIDYGILRLSERVRELEQQGYVFAHVMKSTPQSRGAVGRYCQYVLVRSPKKVKK